MLHSYVLRLVPEALAEARFAGTVQFVRSGRTVAFRSLDELLIALMQHPRESADPSPTIDLDDARQVSVPRQAPR